MGLADKEALYPVSSTFTFTFSVTKSAASPCEKRDLKTGRWQPTGLWKSITVVD